MGKNIKHTPNQGRIILYLPFPFVDRYAREIKHLRRGEPWGKKY
jgi:hypothetical protein